MMSSPAIVSSQDAAVYHQSPTEQALLEGAVSIAVEPPSPIARPPGMQHQLGAQTPVAMVHHELSPQLARSLQPAIDAAGNAQIE